MSTRLPVVSSRVPSSFVAVAKQYGPGLALAAIIALAAQAVCAWSGLTFVSPLIVAITLGAVVRATVGAPEVARSGIRVALRPVLRIGIVLLGFQLTATQVTALGFSGLGIIAVSLVATFVFTVTLARVLGVDSKLAQLIAAGTSICGASAIIATNTVTRASDEDVAYAVACVTLFGTISMVLYPLLLPVLGLGVDAYGVWAGTSIHEVAQVVAAAFQGGTEAGHAGTIAKLTRVMMLAPVVVALGSIVASRAKSGGPARAAVTVPLFIVGFVATTALNSVITIAPSVSHDIARVTAFLLATALAAMGLELDARKLWAKGVRPLALGAAASIFIALFALALVEIAY
ncbi:MAG TPA: putative sulfate exporter family transporter [Alphaproteobacteria bacterium]|nr:putative sulfate exporter family transporter [Alphaproteobacteria bacterium]